MDELFAEKCMESNINSILLQLKLLQGTSAVFF